jgi:DNA-binding MarR family transcriptional regulator
MSSRRGSRKELITKLAAAMRDVSGLSVLHSQAVAGRLGINSTDLECLDLVERGPVAAGALAGATGLTTGAITGVIDRLERAGFVRREADSADRRKVLVRALPKVAEEVEPLFRPMQHAAAAALASYRTEELALLLNFLTRLHEAGLTAMAELQRAPGGSRGRPRE